MGYTQINLQCTDEFKDDLEQWADELGISQSEYLREAARQKAGRQEVDQ